MDRNKPEAGKTAVPLYAKIGWVLAWVVMLGLITMILRNCATSIIYGLQTDQPTIESYYQMGVKDGRSGQNQNARAGTTENSVLHKAYIKGYREGVDSGRDTGNTGGH